MNLLFTRTALSIAAASTLLAVLPACTSKSSVPAADTVTSLQLSGDQEVPPVRTAASGKGTLTIAADGTVSGTVSTSDLKGTMAHIHEAVAGKNGPVVVTLSKATDSAWSVPSATKLTTEQLASYRAGNMYVNVHTEANKDGEIRAQIKP